MPIVGQVQQFTRRNIDLVPDEPGVYALVGANDVAFYGSTRGEETIRSRLRDHLTGMRTPGRDVIDSFSFEITRFPLSRECALLEEHRRRTWRLPSYNDEPRRPAVALVDAVT